MFASDLSWRKQYTKWHKTLVTKYCTRNWLHFFKLVDYQTKISKIIIILILFYFDFFHTILLRSNNFLLVIKIFNFLFDIVIFSLLPFNMVQWKKYYPLLIRHATELVLLLNKHGAINTYYKNNHRKKLQNEICYC